MKGLADLGLGVVSVLVISFVIVYLIYRIFSKLKKMVSGQNKTHD